MGAVRDLVADLGSRGIESEWVSTGGGCYAVAVNFGPAVYHPEFSWFRYEILVTDREDVFDVLDWRRDDMLSGFTVCMYANDSHGERLHDDAVLIYQTPQEAGSALCEVDDDELHLAVNLPAQVLAAVEAIEFVVRAVERADEVGRA